MSEEFSKLLGARIRELRKIKQVSQLDLAYDMDMSMNTISGIELGKISPKIETLKKISLRLGVNLSEMFEFSETDCKDKLVRKKVEEISRRLMGFDKDMLGLIEESIDILSRARNCD